MAAAANIVVAVVGIDALEDEATVELVDAPANVAVDELVVAPAAVAADELVVAPAAVAVDELVVALAAVAVDELVDAEGGTVRGTGPGTEEVGGVEWTAAAAYVAGSLSSSSSKKRSVGSLGPSHVAMGQFS